jgi:twitching motility protein PilT
VPKINRLFDELIARKGSDLHMSIGYPPLVRARGTLMPLREELLDAREQKELLLELLTEDQRHRFSAELDLDFAHAYENKARFRANYFHKTSGVAAVFRTIPTQILTLEELACPEVVRKLADRRAGLVLVTGPTGSGKSTTLAAMIRHINETRACHILTIEDPVEFVHAPIKAHVTHREVGRHAPTFVAAMRSAGREDTNVVLVGELRDSETMRLALQLASFGVLIFATVHTNSAASTIDRILNSFPADEQPQVRGMLAESLIGIIAQQLLPSADGRGRVAALEVLVATSGIAAMIRDGKTFQVPSAIQGGQAIGMQTMDMALERLVAQGKIKAEAAMELYSDKENAERKLRAQQPPEIRVR